MLSGNPLSDQIKDKNNIFKEEENVEWQPWFGPNQRPKQYLTRGRNVKWPFWFGPIQKLKKKNIFKEDENFNWQSSFGQNQRPKQYL